MNTPRFILYAALLASLVLPQLWGATVFAQGDSPAGYRLAWWSVDSGGGPAAGDGVTLHGTLGQPDAGRLTQGEFELVGGFWSRGAWQTPPDQEPPDHEPPDQEPPDQEPPDHEPPDQEPPDQEPPDHEQPEQAPQPLYLPVVMR